MHAVRFQHTTWEVQCSVVECLTRDQGAAASSLVVVLEHCLVLVQPRKTCLCLTERMLMGRKESNQTNQHNEYQLSYSVFMEYFFSVK